ncbi:YveK family protein [Mycobacterium parmense]|uniref:Uncharacterized protein n=1 Tax=Mycobacterium parmense TaxID=185642 RepID=A0A7I7Z1X8_9MYCO|nr:hypothetical protein [Mycobacterium parmense]MCV7352089.1 hypothetical protein [Mycobacterium parmense]ORW56094.1 hypothetical protein AWC20_15275 [Mycobacterium parmense]BBZ48195.1 hypothetical protein MPRM_54760 [Mycobacterium parmense]
MDVGTALSAIRQRWAVIALIATTSIILSSIFALMNPPEYKATAEGWFSVSQPETRPPYALANGSQYILDRMPGYAQLAKTTPVLTPVVDTLHLQETPLTLSGRVTASSLADKTILQVTAGYSDPVAAAHIAEATLSSLGQTVSHIENGNIKVTPVGPATVLPESAQINLITFGLVGAIAGLVLGVFAAVGLEAFRRHRGRQPAESRR